MKKIILLMFLFSGCAVFTPLQKSKLITIYHLIETSNYTEAKEVIEVMKDDEVSGQWARTWYARGLLCQTAYQDGMKNNDRKKFELYPNQLYVAFSSYERARILDPRGRLDRQLAPKYVQLSNEFQKIGERHFRNGEHGEALRAFEQALRIIQSPILSDQPDKNLMYNAALAAYENNDREKAIKYLETLNNASFSTNVLHLLYTLHIEKNDTIMAEQVLKEGIDRYKDNDDIVLLLVDLMFKRGEDDRALNVLQIEAEKNPDKYIYPFTKGLIYQKTEQYQKAIDAYQKAVRIAPDELMSYIQIATCYYNIGVQIEENTRLINNSRRVEEEKEKSAAAFERAVHWLDKAYNKKPENQAVIRNMYQLYKVLSINDKVRSMQGWIN